MTCAWCREALSALLDGEDHPGEQAEVDAHLDRCIDCRCYSNRAAHVTRLARTESVAPLPDLAPIVVRAAEPPHSAIAATHRPRLTAGLRVVLAMLGIGQVGLATNELFGPRTTQDGPSHLNGASFTQLVHESFAWNFALAVGFVCVAARPSRSRALLPLVGAFVAGLAALSALDVAHGRVIGSRLLSHGVVVLGLFVLLALARLARQPTEGAPNALDVAETERRRIRYEAQKSGPDPTHHWHGGGQDLKPIAHRHAA
jgi:predicted anti-sigma-YlaC factor YlaD